MKNENPSPIAYAFDLDEFTKALWKRKKEGVIILVSCVAVAVLLASVLPKKYKTAFSINISSQYFQHPLVGDLVREINDGIEIRSQREAIIRKSISADVLNSLIALDEKNSPTAATSSRSVVQKREDTLDKIEVIAVGPTTLQVAYMAKSRDSSFSGTQLLETAVLNKLKNDRLQLLSNARDALHVRIESLTMAEEGSNPAADSRDSKIIQGEVSRLTQKLESLEKRYTSTHPQVAALRTKVKLLKARIGGANGAKASTAQDLESATPVLSDVATITNPLFIDELVKKFNYLEIAIQMEKGQNDSLVAIITEPQIPDAPIWPRRSFLAMWGLIIGLVGYFGLIVKDELAQFLEIGPEQLAQQLHTTLLPMAIKSPLASSRVGAPTKTF